MAVLLFSILIPVFIGFLLCQLLWQSKKPYFSVKICLSVGLGLGISSCCFFLWLLYLKPEVKSFIMLEAIIIMCLLLMLSLSTRKNPSIAEYSRNMSGNSVIFPPILFVFFVVLVVAVYIFTCFSLENPHGDWDAWGIWNSRARFIFRSCEQWESAFSGLSHWSHPDYPLLVPGVIARCWKYIDSDTTVIPILISMFFTIATAGLLMSTLRIFRGINQALLAGIVLLGTPFYIVNGASQYADVPLSFFCLATMVLFCFKDIDEENSFGLLFLGGAMSGLAAWTKNEGILFLFAVILAHFISVVATKGLKVYIKELYPFAIGLIPVFAVILYFKTQVSSATDLFMDQSRELLLVRLLEPSRYLMIAKAFIKSLFWFGSGLFVMVILYRFLAGENREKMFKTSVMMQAITLSVIIISYFLIYLITPFDLPWHLSTSLKRLFLHLWPSFIFLIFLTARNPEELIKR